MKQTLYVDYEGGKFVSWFYSEGQRYAGKCSHDYEDILRYKRRNDFTDIVLTTEAKLFNNPTRTIPLKIWADLQNTNKKNQS